jgi:MFS family permease
MLVGDRMLMSAVSLNSMALNGSGVFGPSLGGLIIAAVDVQGCFVVNAISYVAVLAAILRMEFPRHAAAARESMGEDMREGLRVLREHRHLPVVFGVVASLSFFGRPYIRMLPAVAREVLHVGPTGLGLLQAAPPVGTILAVFLVNALAGTVRRGRILLTGGAATGLAVALFALSRWFGLSLILLVLVGICQATALAAANTVVQTTVRPEQRGRVMGLYNMVTFGMFALGTMPVGVLASAVGTSAALAAGGVISAVLIALLRLFSPRLASL